RAYLLLDGLEADQPVELGLELVERALGLLLRHAELIGEVVADGLANPLAEGAERVRGILDRVPAHVRTLPACSECGTRTTAPRTSPRRSLSSAAFACSSANTSTCVCTGTRGASARKSSPSRRVRLATERSTRSPQSSSYSNDGMSLM